MGKRVCDKMRGKATILKDTYQKSWTEWLHHRGIYNQVLRSLHHNFKKTVMTINNRIKKTSTRNAKQDIEISTLKRKVESIKALEKALKINHAENQRAIKARYKIIIKEHKRERNKILTWLRRLEVKNQDNGGKGEFLEEYATKLKLKQQADKDIFRIKIQLGKEKKERKKKARHA
mmetsp:Transcript_36148/g.84501  ORF Transcript_36148/g.84501 Transcript_36148/m.84501 type:complete len:176 (+) Transcript_36148:460-987(+)